MTKNKIYVQHRLFIFEKRKAAVKEFLDFFGLILFASAEAVKFVETG